MSGTRAGFAAPGRAAILAVAAVLLATVAVGCVAPAPTSAPKASLVAATASPAPPSLPPTAPPVSPTPTPIPGTAACNPAQLVAKVVSWEGAAGSRIGDVELLSQATVACTIPTVATPNLVDGSGAILIAGPPPTGGGLAVLAPNAVFRTEVKTSNYCGAAPTAPVTVSFVFPSGGGTIAATPVSPTDAGGIPPCNGPGSPATIEMQPFAP